MMKLLYKELQDRRQIQSYFGLHVHVGIEGQGNGHYTFQLCALLFTQYLCPFYQFPILRKKKTLRFKFVRVTKVF